MFVAKKALPRRTFLRAMGATVALPMLDAMVPALGAAPKPTPRFGFIYIANGVIQNQWIPSSLGTANPHRSSPSSRTRLTPTS